MNILAVTTMRNEGPHCLEWFAHHLACGVGHFLVYSNDCDDGTDAILDVLAMAGIVTHHRLNSASEKPVQWQALKHASSQQMYLDADWVLVADCDEFINLQTPLKTLQDLISAIPPDADAIAMPWRLFGSSGQIDMQDMLTTERFTHAAPPDIALPLAHFFKSIFRPPAFHKVGVHRPKSKKDQVPVWVDGGGRFLPLEFGEQQGRINLFGQPVSSDLVQLNHYSLRSAESFMVKRARGLPNHTGRDVGLGYWVERNFNTVEDKSIHSMIPATKTKLAELLEIPGLADLHRKAQLAHRATFEKMMTDRQEVQLFWQILLCQNSQPPTPEIARAHIARIVKSTGA